MQIRPLTAEDAPVLRECRLRGLRESADAFLTTYDEARDTPLDAVRAELRNADIRYVGAFEGDDLIGFMRFVRGERRARRHTAEVRSVHVRGDRRRRGVALALLRQLIRDATDAGLESLTISVLSNNAAARALYESAGFATYGIEPRAVKKGADYFDQVHLVLHLSTT